MSVSRLWSLGRAAILPALLAACAPVPDLGARPSPRAAANIPAAQSFAATQGVWPADRWWAAYGDAQLTQLIDEGLAGSPDIAAAAARFRRAVGLAQQAGAARLPTLDATGSATLNKQSYTMGFPKEFVPKGWLDMGQLALNADFDIDLWGRNRAALAAATSEARAAEIETAQAQLLLTTGIADAYAQLAELYAERDIAQRALELRQSTQQLIQQREANGLETRGNLRQSDSTVATAQADLAAVDESIALRRNQIAALIGAGPDRGRTITRPQLRSAAALGVPADATTELVARRPDVTAALLRLEAAAARIKVAHADFFPAIRLSGLIGLQSLGLDQLISRDSVYGNVGPAISLPIFRGGSLSGRFREARAGYDEAVANYDGAVLAAYREVADAVVSRQALAQRLQAARTAREASESAYAIARQRYEGGLSTYLDVLDVEDRVLAARRAVVALEARAFTLNIALIRALGGGFSTSKDPSNG